MPYEVRSRVNERYIRTTTSLENAKKCQSFLKIWKMNRFVKKWTTGFKRTYGKIKIDKHEMSYIFKLAAPKTSYMKEDKVMMVKLKTAIYSRKNLSFKFTIY
jgi:hypothetical protein